MASKTDSKPVATVPAPAPVAPVLPAGWPTVLTAAAKAGGWAIAQLAPLPLAGGPVAYVNKRAIAKGATPGWHATFTRGPATFTCATLANPKSGTHHGGVYALAQNGKVRVVRHGYVVAATLASKADDKGATVVADNDETRKRAAADDS